MKHHASWWTYHSTEWTQNCPWKLGIGRWVGLGRPNSAALCQWVTSMATLYCPTGGQWWFVARQPAGGTLPTPFELCDVLGDLKWRFQWWRIDTGVEHAETNCLLVRDRAYASMRSSQMTMLCAVCIGLFSVDLERCGIPVKQGFPCQHHSFQDCHFPSGHIDR